MVWIGKYFSLIGDSFFSSTNLVSIIFEFLYYYHAIHGNIWIITYSVFKYMNFRSPREWVLVFTFNKYFMPFAFSFTFFMSGYSSAAGSVVYIFVVHNSFWLLCHIYLGAAPTFSASAAHRGGKLERMDEVSDCNHGWHTQTSKPLIFFCLLNKSCRTN